MLHGDHIQAVLQGPNDESLAFSESDRKGSTSSAKTESDGKISTQTTGRTRTGEVDTHAVCKSLSQAVTKTHGIQLRAVKHKGHEEGVDGWLAGPKDVRIPVQVTRAHGDERFWRDLGRGRSTKEHGTPAEMANYLRAALESKANRARIDPGLVLALDATYLPGLALDSVLTEFQIRHGTWAKGLNFIEIWIVGPSHELTRRLDID